MCDQSSDRERNIEDALSLLAPHPRLLLAVSGGPDSVALMLACARWSARGAHEIAVATVDHGLRDGSRAEAEQVAQWARALGFAHRLLTWRGEKPRTRIQELARAARYGLLADCALDIGAAAIVTAHHADDQAETILFRLTRGSGVAGLAGMARSGQCGGVALLRPFLHVPKADLEALCAREGHDFIRDPSNANDRFARVRLRALAPLLAEQGLDRDALLRLGARAAQADAALCDYAAETLARARIIDDGPGVSLDAPILRNAPIEILQRVIALAIVELAPHATLRLERLERATQRAAIAIAQNLPLRLTLADVSIAYRNDRIVMSIAPPRRTGR